MREVKPMEIGERIRGVTTPSSKGWIVDIDGDKRAVIGWVVNFDWESDEWELQIPFMPIVLDEDGIPSTVRGHGRMKYNVKLWKELSK